MSWPSSVRGAFPAFQDAFPGHAPDRSGLDHAEDGGRALEAGTALRYYPPMTNDMYASKAGLDVDSLTTEQLENIALLEASASEALSKKPATSMADAGRLHAGVLDVALRCDRKAAEAAASVIPRLYQCVGTDAVRLAMGPAGSALRGLKRDWDDKVVEKRGLKLVSRRATEDDGLTERQAIVEILKLFGAKPSGHGKLTVDKTVEGRLAEAGEPAARRLMIGVTYCDYRGCKTLKTAVRVALRQAADAGDGKTVRFVADLLCALACYDETMLDLGFPVDKVTADWITSQAARRSLKSLAIDWAVDPESVFPD